MYKIVYWNPDGAGLNETEPWVSDPVNEEDLEKVLDSMKSKGCSIVRIIDIGRIVYFTRKELEMLVEACMRYKDQIPQGMAGGGMSAGGEHAAEGASEDEFGSLADKIMGYMEDGAGNERMATCADGKDYFP